MIVISPHLDDAVFGCGALLAGHPGSIVVTLFAGVPRGAEARTTEWDRRCGFADARQAIAARRAEDERALALLGARPYWLDFGDSQYGCTPPVEALSAALREALAPLASDATVLPLGLFHSDHLLAHAASLRALRELPPRPVAVYEDALYRGLRGLLQQRLAELARAGLTLTPARLPRADAACEAAKARAVARYASQLRAFGPGGLDDAARAERCWQIEPTTDGPA
jgi:LmbE family N-acetylglucosaminyl deacetylase